MTTPSNETEGQHTADELAAEILRVSDLGDIEISVQDDMPMVSVRQDASGFTYAMGDTIVKALNSYLRLITRPPLLEGVDPSRGTFVSKPT